MIQQTLITEQKCNFVTNSTIQNYTSTVIQKCSKTCKVAMKAKIH